MFRDVVDLLVCMTWIRVGACCIVVCNFRATPCRVILFRLVFWIGSVRIQTIQIHCKSVRFFGLFPKCVKARSVFVCFFTGLCLPGSALHI